MRGRRPTIGCQVRVDMLTGIDEARRPRCLVNAATSAASSNTTASPDPFVRRMVRADAQHRCRTSEFAKLDVAKQNHHANN